MKVKIYECPHCGYVIAKVNYLGCRKCGYRGIDLEYVGECDVTEEYRNRCKRRGELIIGPDDFNGRMCANPIGERLYRKAMERMKYVISNNGTKEDIIALMEQEIDGYRNKLKHYEGMYA